MPVQSPYCGSLYTDRGQRKYLTPAERMRFLETAKEWPRFDVKTLCLTLANTGCRISEAIALSAASVQVEGGFIAVRSLKKRKKKLVVRELPVSMVLLNTLQHVHGLENADPAALLWPLCRSRAWFLVKEVMQAARIDGGPHATAKGLRHSFGLHAIRSGVPLNLVQRWLGHASITTTAIYLEIMGEEEHEIASRMW